jgi:hypothetical protein
MGSPFLEPAYGFPERFVFLAEGKPDQMSGRTVAEIKR